MPRESHTQFDNRIAGLIPNLTNRQMVELVNLIELKVEDALRIERVNSDATHAFLQHANLELSGHIHQMNEENTQLENKLASLRWQQAFLKVRMKLRAGKEHEIRQKLASEVSEHSRTQNIATVPVMPVPPSIYMQACQLGAKLTLAYSLNETMATYTGIDCLEKLYVKPACRWLFGVEKKEPVVPQAKRVVPDEFSFEDLLAGKKMTAGNLLPPEKVFDVSFCVGDPTVPIRWMVTYHW